MSYDENQCLTKMMYNYLSWKNNTGLFYHTELKKSEIAFRQEITNFAQCVSTG